MKQRRSLATNGATTSEHVPLLAAAGAGMFLLKDGSLARVYELLGGDIDTMTQDEKDRQAQQICQVLRLFNDEIMVWLTVQRRRTKRDYSASYKNKIQQFLHNEYAKQFLRTPAYEIKTYLTIVQVGSRHSNFLDSLLFHSAAGRSAPAALWRATTDTVSRKKTYQHSEERLKSATESFAGFLADFEAGMSGKLRPLDEIETITFYHSLAAPASNNTHPLKMPRAEAPLDAAIADNHIRRFGERFAPDLMEFTAADKKIFGGAVTIREWANIVNCGAWDELLEIRAEMTITCVMSFMDAEVAQKMLRSLEQKIFLSFRNLSDVAVRFANRGEEDESGGGRAKAVAAEEVQEAGQRTVHERMQWAHCFVQIIAFGDNPESANAAVAAVAACIRRTGHSVARQTLDLLPAWSASMPGRWDGVNNWWALTVEYFTDLLPLRTLAAGDPKNHYLSSVRNKHTSALSPFYTPGKGVFNLDLHTGSYGRQDGDNGHFFLVAPPGSGKTVLANWLILCYQKYNPTRIIVLDKDLSCKIPILLQDGTYIETGGEKQINMNPLILLSDLSRHGEFLIGWLTRLLAQEGVKIRSSEIEDALRQLAATERKTWRLKHLVTLLPANAAEALSPWIEGKIYGGLDCSADVFENLFQKEEYLIGIDLKRIFADAKFGPPALDYIIYRIEMATAYESTGGAVRPGMIYIEEAWNVLKLPRLAGQLEDWLRTLRKRTFVVGLATQSLREFKDGGLFEILNDSIPNRFFLGNPQAGSHSELYKAFGLNDEDIEAIRLMIVGMFFYCKNTHLKKRLQLNMPPIALRAFITNESALNNYETPKQYMPEAYL